MNIEDRKNYILDILHKEKTVEVTDLARRTGTSLVTIRKDLTALEEKKLLVRERGYARLNTENLMAVRMSTHYSIKKKIAQKAADLVHEGDTIMIESGSTCVILADELAQSKKQVTIVTNSLYLAEYTGSAPNLTIILTGGEYLAPYHAAIGPAAKAVLDTYHARLFFTGTDGYSIEGGFTGDNLQKAEIIRQMSERSDQTIVLMEKSRFSEQGAVSVLQGDIHPLIIVNELPDEEICSALKTQGAKFIVA